MAKFGTVEVYEEMGKVLNDDDEWINKRGTKISYSMVFDYGEPVDKAFYTRFESGRVTDVHELDSRGEIEADFVIAGSADVWRGVLTNTIDPTVALTRGQLKVKGKMATLLKNMNAFKYVIEKMSQIPLD
ncbi:SCP2 sterol-binding domain-containing protein [Mycolicibacterium pulveris]|uniref:SCP2 domain-containing protein n=1 Tax=Mycolicibacterium pulveris TaxID=36813 RepID=A0A7I7US77_MYCPV|nr:SCP2 sterol-binding domain-containing protein [Mycolicibacterium pulveris]MCV6983839.1 SCP2 sterol-binding domain-containing protein [Mycolicibacterium pulveris]BBY83723.1 hypothetical protein MPUL_48810 [Mycolicibacterium pulveris]